MKNEIKILIETNNIIPIYNEVNEIDITLTKKIEDDIHRAISNWVKDNLTEEIVSNVILQNYYDMAVVDGIEDISDYGNLKITFSDKNSIETVLDVKRFVSEDEKTNLLKTTKEEKIEEDVPPMQLDDGAEEELEFEEDEEDFDEDKIDGVRY